MELRGDFKPIKVFLAEGDAEAFFMESLFEKEGCSEEEYCIFCIKGITNLKPALKIITNEDNFGDVRSLGIMVDADNNPNGRLESIIASLISVNCVENGIEFNENNIANYNGLNIGIFISPGNENEGTIETLVVNEIQTKQINECIDNFSECLTNFGEEITNKAITQIYISIKKPGLCGTGRGFKAGILDVEDHAYESARNTFINL